MAQIATITVETAGGPVDLPVYEPGDSGSGRLEAFRVQTASGPGFVPLAAVDEADRPYLRVQTSSGVRAVDTSASGIPDSSLYHIPISQRSNSTIVEELENQNLTAQGTTNVTGNWEDGYAEDAENGGYIELPSAYLSWLESSQNKWMAMTLDANPPNISDEEGFFGFVDTNQSPTEFWQVNDPNGDGTIRWTTRGNDGSKDRIITDNPVLDGTKKRIVLQRTGPTANDMEIWVNGSEAATTVQSAQGFNGTFDTTFNPLVLTVTVDGSPFGSTDSAVDNLIFGQQGTTLAQSDIELEYQAQPWS